ncbi:MAG: hypothetical protein FJ279_04460 [Planctomycetes bacterium]|nr:hypothetical protein [Planctomycetota bacterium]
MLKQEAATLLIHPAVGLVQVAGQFSEPGHRVAATVGSDDPLDSGDEPRGGREPLAALEFAKNVLKHAKVAARVRRLALLQEFRLPRRLKGPNMLSP